MLKWDNDESLFGCSFIVWNEGDDLQSSFQSPKSNMELYLREESKTNKSPNIGFKDHFASGVKKKK